jgi:signal transduction histidine kinase
VNRLINWRTAEFRLLAFYGLLLLVLGLAVSLFTVRSLEHFEMETVRSNIEHRAREVWTVGSAAIGEPQALGDLIERRFSPSTANRFIRISSDSLILYQSGPPASGEFDPTRIPLPRSAADVLDRQYGDLYLVTRSFDADGHRILVESGQSIGFAWTIRRNLISSLLIGLSVLLAFATLGGYFLMRQAWMPLSRMIHAAEVITVNDPHTRLPVTDAGGRLAALAQSLNRMLDRLDAAYGHVSRFSADAAHELRTPLAIIRGEIEYLADQPELGAASQEAIGTIAEEVRRLADMTENLLTLAGLDSSGGGTPHARLDLHALACETLEQISVLAEEKQIQLMAPVGGPVTVSADRGRLKQVLVNLLDNAIKYTPRQGTVSVRIEQSPEVVRLIVADTGIGILPEHLESIFERFFRISTDRGERGTGLGLSIARSICQAHGGTLTVRSVPGQGSQFCVELPLERV